MRPWPGANTLGFNFYPRSPRYIAPERAARIASPAGVRRVGVFVDETAGAHRARSPASPLSTWRNCTARRPSRVIPR